MFFFKAKRPVLNLASISPHHHPTVCVCVKARAEEATVSCLLKIAGAEPLNEAGLSEPWITSSSWSEVAEMTFTQKRMSMPSEWLSSTRGSWNKTKIHTFNMNSDGKTMPRQSRKCSVLTTSRSIFENWLKQTGWITRTWPGPMWLCQMRSVPRAAIVSVCHTLAYVYTHCPAITGERTGSSPG